MRPHPSVTCTASLAISLCVVMFWSDKATAQNDLEINEIEVIKHFDARLIETQKVLFTARLPELDTTARNYQYAISIVHPTIDYKPPQIRPLALRPEEQPKHYRGILRAGYGIPNAILGELSYLVINTDPLQLSVSGHHHSANNKKIDLQKFSDSGGEIDASYIVSPALLVTGNVGYDIDKVHFYGLEPDDDIPYVDESRTFRTFKAAFGIGNTESLPGHINYNANVAFYNHKDDLAAKETGIDLLLRGEKWFSGKHVMSLDLNADLSSLKDSEQKRSLDNLVVNPSFAFHQKTFSLAGGVNVSVHDGDVFFFPEFEAQVQISGNRLIAFAEIDGGLSKNTFYSLSTYNPYIHQRIDEIRNTEHRDYGAGVKGKIGKLDYRGMAGYSTIEGLTLFEPDLFDYRKFQPLYDNGNVIRVEGEIKTDVIPNLNVGAVVSKPFYDLDVQEKPWHLPSLNANVFASFLSPDKKLKLRGDLFVENGAPFVNDVGDVDRLKGLFDISVGADYFFTKNIGAFFQANNLLGNKHQRWQRYPVYGVNGVAGVLVRI